MKNKMKADSFFVFLDIMMITQPNEEEEDKPLTWWEKSIGLIVIGTSLYCYVKRGI